MRAIGSGILILLVIHLLAAGGFAAWLYQSGRVDRERIEKVVDTFRLTTEEQEALEEQAARIEAETRQVAERAARLEAVAEGPLTLRDRLAMDEQAEELVLHRLERLQRETSDVRRQIEQARETLTRKQAELEAEREAFDRFLEERTQRLQEEDFQQAVEMYEQLRPRQAKQMMQELIDQGHEDEVVGYLAAMQLRKAAAVLAEFQAPEEVPTATRLVQRLRQQGEYDGPDAAQTGEAAP